MTDFTPVPVGTDLPVNRWTASDQIEPSIAPLANGGFVVVWSSRLQDGNNNGVFGQMFDSSGNYATGIDGFTPINTYTSQNQEYPAVAALEGGGFVVTWSSYYQDGSFSGIYGQRFDESGSKVGSEFGVNSTTTGNQIFSTIAPLRDGGFVITWMSVQDGDGYGIYGQRFDASGARAGSEFEINTVTAGNQEFPTVAALADGGFVVTWSSPDGNGSGVVGRRYDSSGAATGDAFTINTFATSDQRTPAVAPLADGGFVVTWTSRYQDGSGYGVFGQRFDAAGAKAGGEFQVNTFTTRGQGNSSVTPLADGGFLVIWSSDRQDGSGVGVYGQRYDHTGAAAGGEFRLNDITSGDQATVSSSTVALLTDGRVVATWSGYGPEEVFARLIEMPRENTAPTGQDGIVLLSEDGSHTFATSDFGFTDADPGAALSAVRIDTLPAAGALTLDGNPVAAAQVIAASDLSKLVFRPGADANGQGFATLTFSMSDGVAFDPTPNTIRFDVTPVNDAPVLVAALADQSVAEDSPWSFQVPAGTFTDVDSVLSYSATLGDGSTLPGWLSFDTGTRTFSGTPPANFNGVIELKVTASDGSLVDSDTFTLTVAPVNDAPTTSPVTLLPAAGEDGSRIVTAAEFLANASDVDRDPLTLSGLAASSGALVDNGNGSWTFTPVPDDDTGVSFTYTVSDGEGGTVADSATLDLLPVNDAPTATNDLVAIVENETREASVLTNDGDVDAGQTLTVIAVSGASGAGTVGQELVGTYGSLTLQADGSYSYAARNTTLPEGATASETFAYTVSDGHGGTAHADIVVTVTGGRPLPPGDGEVRGTISSAFAAEAAGDFDGNGTLDVLWRNPTTSAVELWTTATNGAVVKTSLGAVGANWLVEAVGNLDGKDGDDIVLRDTATGDLGAWIMRNGGQPSDWRALGTLGAEWDLAGAGDVDRNGTDDLLLFNAGTGAVDVFLQSASGPGARATVGTLPAGWTISGIGDLDANGTDDVLLFNATTRQLGAWQMSEGKVGGWYDYGPLAAGWAITEVGNFDGRGAEDIGFYNATTGADGAWSMARGAVSGWLEKPAHDDLDPIGAGRIGSTTEQILWHNPITGAVVTF